MKFFAICTYASSQDLKAFALFSSKSSVSSFCSKFKGKLPCGLEFYREMKLGINYLVDQEGFPSGNIFRQADHWPLFKWPISVPEVGFWFLKFPVSISRQVPGTTCLVKSYHHTYQVVTAHPPPPANILCLY